MKLLSLQLKNFRTYANLELEFPSRLCFLTGANANGKTNVIEAIGLLSIGKSFRGASDEDMVRDGEQGYYIEGKFEKDGQLFELSFGLDLSGGRGKARRRIKLNGKQLPGRSALIGHIVSVIFSPQDILIAEGGPSYRRRFLDLVLSYQNPAYFKQLLAFNRALRQRNALLKKIKGGKARMADVDPWNGPLIEHGGHITRARRDFVLEFESIFHDSLQRISGNRDTLNMRLVYSADGEGQDYGAALKRYAVRDSALGYTGVGPHRQNLLFERDGQDILRFGSQGQRRSLVLALRIAQFWFLKKSLRLSPLLLIDDVIRELDARRRGAFVQLLEECGQAVFTTPDLDGLDSAPGGLQENLRRDMTVYHVAEIGRMERR